MPLPVPYPNNKPAQIAKINAFLEPAIAAGEMTEGDARWQTAHLIFGYPGLSCEEIAAETGLSALEVAQLAEEVPARYDSYDMGNDTELAAAKRRAVQLFMTGHSPKEIMLKTGLSTKAVTTIAEMLEETKR